MKRIAVILGCLLSLPVWAIPVYFSNDRNFDGTFDTTYADGSKPPSTEWDGDALVYADNDIRIPFDSIPKATGLHGTYDVWVRAVDAAGTATGTEVLIEDVEIYTDQGASQAAFPGADGWAKTVSGGRGGSVLFVTNTNNSGAGSLRTCIEATGARNCVFEVAGRIQLSSELSILNDDISIWGQSAPGLGVQITNRKVRFAADNLLARYLKIRLGDDNGALDAAGINGSTATTGIMLDHFDINFGTDENFELSGRAFSEITLSNWINAYSLHCSGESGSEPCHSKGMLCDAAPGQRAPTMVSHHYNIVANHADRIPALCKDGLHNMENNLFFNKQAGGSAWLVSRPEDGPLQWNIIDNYWDNGPLGSTTTRMNLLNHSNNPTGSSVYRSGNFDPDGASDTASFSAASNWTVLGSPQAGFPRAEADIATAEDVPAYVLANAGARCPAIDSLTQRVLDDVAGVTTGEIIDHESEVGGFPDLTASGTSHPAGYDDDDDGIEDDWELYASNNVGLTQSTERLNGWTNLENFMHDKAGDCAMDGDYTFITFDDDPQGGDTDGYEVYIVAPGTAFSAALPKDRMERTAL